VILHWFTKVFPALQEQCELTMACDETGGNRLSDLAASVLARERGGCARAASGYAAAAPPSSVMNARRLRAGMAGELYI